MGRMKVGMVLFEDFELLDVAGPLEVLGNLLDDYSITLYGPRSGPVRSAQGVSILADAAYEGADELDIVIVPGGYGTRSLVGDDTFIAWLRDLGARTHIVASVCTGAALLGRAGLLEGHSATSNLRAFDWVCAQAPAVDWQQHVRWVEDGNRWTSAGVAAGIDMTLALVSRLQSPAVARDVAAAIEYPWPPTDVDDSGSAILTIFRSRLRQDSGPYETVARELEQLARAQDGFQDFKTFQADDGERCSIVIFADEDAQQRWRDHPQHRVAQQRAAKEFYATYSVLTGYLRSSSTYLGE